MAESGQADTPDWQEEAYQKLKAMKELYLPNLIEMHQKLCHKLQKEETDAQKPEGTGKLSMMKLYMERIIAYLQVSKSNIPITHRDKLSSYEKQILGFISSIKVEKPVSTPQQI
ncbi:hypothetical protein AQUCO_00500026v1 [Aquilegia coerulea]|uniref:Mediator complex subunit 15 KIX domain-containing protein n=1 Tax=Aquilegia coerulea TaxID=218851 RepID=A0A2G5EPY8_AQUCA|nr:hypothetical protein AQUCO_00500026v1 [Aquilegia coerulea]